MKLLIIFCCMFIILLPHIVYADLDYDFNGVKWGSKLSSSKDFKLFSKSDESNTKFYTKPRHQFYNGIQVVKVVYIVDKGVFNKAYIDLDSNSYEKVRDHLLKQYGKPTSMAGREVFEITSNGKSTRIVLQPGLVNFYHVDSSK